MARKARLRYDDLVDPIEALREITVKEEAKSSSVVGDFLRI